MARPQHGTGRTTDWREDLNSNRRNNPDAFRAMIETVKQIYITEGNIKATAEKLKIAKRTLERAMSDIPELLQAINEVRVAYGR